MAARRLTSERAARVVAVILAAGLPLAALLARWSGTPAAAGGAVEVHGAVPEAGGWLPGNLTVRAGQPLRLRLTSDDVLHGWAIGQTDIPAVDVMPGQVTETTVLFERPGTYTFYCTRWCGPNHWRMRGTIEVVGRLSPGGAVAGGGTGAARGVPGLEVLLTRR